MAFCNNCGTQLEGQEKFCHNCGAEITPKEKEPEKKEPVPAKEEEKPIGWKESPENQYQQEQTARTQENRYQQQQPQQNYYRQPNYGAAAYDSPLSVGQFILMFILLSIPIANIVLLFVWAFGGDVNINKRNYARAVLILMLIGISLTIVITIAFISFFSQIAGSYSYNF